jgi:3-hydroxyacyl-[acyl-carrier-protein] dehydratase
MHQAGVGEPVLPQVRMRAQLDCADISRILPHGRAMTLVDRAECGESGTSIVGLKAITATDACYVAVARDAPLPLWAYPTSLLVESFGQTAALLWLRNRNMSVGDQQVLMFVSARDITIEGTAFPGDVLRHCATMDKGLDETLIVSGETRVGDRRVATFGSMIAVVRPRSSVLNRSDTREGPELRIDRP